MAPSMNSANSRCEAEAVLEEWKREARPAIEQVREMREGLLEVTRNTKHLEKLDDLSDSVTIMNTRMDEMIQLLRTFGRYLIIVVCAIALGKTAVDLIRDEIRPHAVKVQGGNG